MIKLNERIQLMARLGDHLRRGDDDYLAAVIQRTSMHNPWFTVENQERAIDAVAEHFLTEDQLRAWVAAYDWCEPEAPRTVGLVMAGNLPLVGFHDLLSVFIAGHRAQIKLSEKDPYLLPYLIKLLARFDERGADYFRVVERLDQFDAVIATGSNNSARYFEAYFGKYPHIIRRNRNGVAVLTGEESHEELHQLGKDVFRYFGLGCRSVAKLFVPRGYDFEPLLEALHDYREIILHTKYKNNFDYNYALLVLNKAPFLSNGCIILTEDEAYQSRIAGLHYSFYSDLNEVTEELRRRAGEVQLIVARPGLLPLPTVPFGQAQEPGLMDYADGVDTMGFLLGLG